MNINENELILSTKFDITPEVEKISKLNFIGNIIPNAWYHNIRLESGAVDLVSITLLSEILYWYRCKEIRDETTGKLIAIKKKFAADALQRSKGSFAKQFGFTERQVKESLGRLEKLNLIKRDFRTVKTSEDMTLANVLFIIIYPEEIEKISFNFPLKGPRGYDIKTSDGGGENIKKTEKSRGYDIKTSDGNTFKRQPHIYSTEITTENKDIAQSAAPLRQKDLVFSFDSKKFENINTQDLDNWKILYPSVDISQELLRMQEWCLSNPSKSKSKKLWRKFVTNWLKNANEEKTNKEAYFSRKQESSNSNYDNNRKFVLNVISNCSSNFCELSEDGKEVIFIPLSGESNHPTKISYKDFGFENQFTHHLKKWNFQKK